MKILVLDTETTGLKQPSAIVEIAWAEVSEDLEVIRKVCSLIDPEMPIEPGASGVHGLTNSHVADAPTLEEFLTIVESDPFGGGEIVIVAHNAAFDMKYVGPRIPKLAATVCTLMCSRKLYPDAPDHKLQTLRYYLDLDVEDADAHSASGDVAVCLALLKRMVHDSGLSFQGLIELSKPEPRTPNSRITFGKHKGKKLSELPTDYIDWLLNKADNLDSELRTGLTHLKSI